MRQFLNIKNIGFILGIGVFSITVGFLLKTRFFNRSHSSHYLCRIIQTGPQKESLKTTYLAELMQISADHPVKAFDFDLSLAQKRLLSSPVIKEAIVKLIRPDTIYIDYTIRQPIVWFSDFENLGLDEEGYPFPVFPFFTPKNLPSVYLGVQQITPNQPLMDQKIQLSLKLLKVLFNMSFHAKLIDVSKAFHESLGIQEIVVTIEEEKNIKYLRLTPKNFNQELANYTELRKRLPSKTQMIDLRISHLAFIQTYEKEDF